MGQFSRGETEREGGEKRKGCSGPWLSKSHVRGTDINLAKKSTKAGHHPLIPMWEREQRRRRPKDNCISSPEFLLFREMRRDT